jgi:C1A family cysteine protease
LAAVRAAITRKGAKWQAGRTSVSKLTVAQLRRRTGLIEDRARVGHVPLLEAPALPRALPRRFDWREHDGVTDVQNQGQCGSCVSFASVAAIESRLRIYWGLDLDLSEADLHFCSGRVCRDGWWPGWPGGALPQAESRGVCEERGFPYPDGVGSQSCAVVPDRADQVVKIAGGSYAVTPDNLKFHVSMFGPAVACFDVYEDLKFYDSGVYTHITGKLVGGHAVAVVGYDDEEKCWICKNSWGTGFGEAGYLRIGYGQCGIDNAYAMTIVSGLVSYGGWEMVDRNPESAGIVAAGDDLYQIHRDGRIWRYTGRQITGWQELDNNPATKAIAAGNGTLYQIHDNGLIWRYTGPPLTGWQLIDDNAASVAITADAGDLYQLHGDGRIWRYRGIPMSGWQELDNNAETKSIAAAGGRLYQIHKGGAIWRFTGRPMTGWQLLGDNPASTEIAAAGGDLYQLHRDGRIWRYTGTPMTGWEELDDNPATTAIRPSVGEFGGHLYQMHRDGSVWRYAGPPHTGWLRISNDPDNIAIAAASRHTYRIESNGRIWRYLP